MPFDARHLLLGFAVLYSLIWVAIGLYTGAMMGRGGKIRRVDNPRGYWLQMALRGSVGLLAGYLFAAGG